MSPASTLGGNAALDRLLPFRAHVRKYALCGGMLVKHKEISRALVSSVELEYYQDNILLTSNRGIDSILISLTKVSPDWICAVTSRFTKLFYCER